MLKVISRASFRRSSDTQFGILPAKQPIQTAPRPAIRESCFEPYDSASIVIKRWFYKSNRELKQHQIQDKIQETARFRYSSFSRFGRRPDDARKFSPTSVQFKGEINGALPRKRHQKRHLEFCNAYLLSRGSGVRFPPGAPDFLIPFNRNELEIVPFTPDPLRRPQTVEFSEHPKTCRFCRFFKPFVDYCCASLRRYANRHENVTLVGSFGSRIQYTRRGTRCTTRSIGSNQG